MIPLELKIDKDGLFYLDDERLIHKRPLKMCDFSIEEKYFNYAFYEIPSTSDYIIKYCSTIFTKSQIKEIKEMLKILIISQPKIDCVDFPIGYYSHSKKLSGQIIKNYPKSLSIDKIVENRDINSLNKYYYHDDNPIHNLFLLFEEVLNSLKVMYDNNILYFDTNPGNVVIYNNLAKIIDFDYRYIKFNKNDSSAKYLFQNYVLFVKSILENYDMNYNVNGYYGNFVETKDYVKRLEKEIRNR